MSNKIIAVDFDGTLCENKWPEIGEANEELIWYLRTRQAAGDKIILWTCRVGDLLQQAVHFCYDQGLIFDAVNENLPETIEWMKGDSRKIFAHEYIDDRNRLISSCREKSSMEQWAEEEVKIACQHEAPDRKDGEWDYGRACYEGALEAFRTLCGQGHSGMSIGFTKSILNRLIDGKPLRPIEDTEDAWYDVSERFGTKGKGTEFQCKRMSSLFKKVSTDGTVRYSDVSRYYGVDISNPSVSYHNGLIDKIGEVLFPITMPYMPADKPFKIYTEDFLVDPKNGDYDTRGILYAITPSGDRVEINRFFKEIETGFEEISEDEYNARKSAYYGCFGASNNDCRRCEEVKGEPK